MPNIFDQIAAKQQPQPAVDPSPATLTKGNIFDRIAAGEDVMHPSEPDQGPGFIEPDDKGVMNSLKRNTAGLFRLPGHVINAFSQPIETDSDAALAGAIMGTTKEAAKMGIGEGDPQTKFALHTMLGFKRLIVDPMLAEHEQAKAYDAMYDKMTPEEKKKADEFFAVSSARHLANMHHLASIIPLLGPAAGQMVDRMSHGDVSGGLTDLIFNIATAGAMKKLGNRAQSLAPTIRRVAGEDVPVLASQTGDRLATVAQTAAKATGAGGGLNRFVEEQSAAIQRAGGKVANDTAQGAIRRMNAAGGPDHVYQSTELPPEDFLNRIGGEKDVMQRGNADLEDKFLKPRRNAAGQMEKMKTWPEDEPPVQLRLNEKGDLIEADGRYRAALAKKAGIEKIPVTISREISNEYALARSGNFQEAAEALRTAAKPKLQVVNDATKGRMGEIMDERDALMAKARDVQSVGAWNKLQKQLTDLAKEEDDLFQPQNPTTGRFQSPLTNYQRAQFNAATRAWKQANAMDQLHAAIDSDNPVSIGKRIKSLGDDVISKAVDSDPSHIAAIREMADILSSGEKATKVNQVLRVLRFVTSKGSLGGSNALSYGLGKVLTSPAAANALAKGIKAGAAIPTISQSVDKILEKEQKVQ